MVHVHTHPAGEPAADPKRRYLCRHVFTDGHRCGSPSLRGQELCYYHRRTREGEPIAHRTGIFAMPRIDDRAALHLAIYDILSRLTNREIDWKLGAVLLRGLQIASTNLARQDQPTSRPLPQVEDVCSDHTLGDLAPIVEIPEPYSIPAAHALDVQREYTAEEAEYLRQTATLTGYAPGNRRCPPTLTQIDIVIAINNKRHTAGLPPLGDEPGWTPSEPSAPSPANSPLPDEDLLDIDRLLIAPAGQYADWDEWTPEECDGAQNPAKLRELQEATERFFAEFERAQLAATPSLALAAVRVSNPSPPAANSTRWRKPDSQE